MVSLLDCSVASYFRSTREHWQWKNGEQSGENNTEEKTGRATADTVRTWLSNPDDFRQTTNQGFVIDSHVVLHGGFPMRIFAKKC